jgi:type VI secretion system protein ImpA
MALDLEQLTQPVSDAEPCGPPLRYEDDFDALREIATGSERPEWARALDRALALAGRGRDLRVWVWLTRASMCADGLSGLADGLDLIAAGVDRFWDELPPFDPDESDPRERHLARLMALTELGVTNFRSNLDDLTRGTRNITDLQADLEDLVRRAAGDPATPAALARCRAAMERIEETFRSRCGDGHDPQLGFDLLLDTLRQLEGGTEAAAGAPQVPSVAADTAAIPGYVLGAITSREDVVRVFKLVLKYYEIHEPSSPVPLLLNRAIKLVPMSFADAVRELSPSGMSELNRIAGTTDEEDEE